MSVVKQFKQKSGDSFSDTYDLGVNGVNVDLAEGKDLETKLKEIQTTISDNRLLEQSDIKAVNTALDKKADKNHASDTTDYGVGTKNKYGHLKISNVYNKEEDDSSNTTVSQQGIVEMYKKLSNTSGLQVFYLIDNSTGVLSVLNTGYVTALEPTEIYLVPNYFSVIEGNDGYYTLIAFDGNDIAEDELFEVSNDSLIFNSVATAYLDSEDTRIVNLVSGYYAFSNLGNDNYQLTITT